MCISNLLFLSNELMDTKHHTRMGLPLTFISFGFIEGKMYTHHWKHGTFVVRDEERWGNTICYGGLFLLNDFHFYIRLLDAYYACSRSVLKRNHINDLHHRELIQATPISFQRIEELEHLKYQELEDIQVHAYVGNLNHPKIHQRIHAHVSYRLIDGVDVMPFLNLYKGVTT